MAAPATLNASTLEGQLLQIVQHVIDTQTKALVAASDVDRPSIKRIVQGSTTDLLNGTLAVSLSIPLDTEPTATGIGVAAATVY